MQTGARQGVGKVRLSAAGPENGRFGKMSPDREAELGDPIEAQHPGDGGLNWPSVMKR